MAAPPPVKILWATDPAGVWEDVDPRHADRLPKKDLPPVDRQPIFETPDNRKVIDFEGTPVEIDDQPGHVWRACVQGVHLATDHIAYEWDAQSETITMTGWDDDADDREVKYLKAVVVEFTRIPKGENATFHQKKTLYLTTDGRLEREVRGKLPQWTRLPTRNDPGEKVTVLKYDDFVVPGASITFHGIWLLQDHHEALRQSAIDNPAPWMDWQEV